MRHTLAEAFGLIFEHFEFTDSLSKQLYTYRVNYMTANREHMEFFGGNLLGVNRVFFKDSDVNNFFDIFSLEFSEVVHGVREVTTIDHSFKVGGDVFNLTIMYLIHRVLTSKMSNSHKQKAAHDLAMIFFCRCAAILISANFNYAADPKVAQLAYSNLSQKYLIKRLGSWNLVMDYRANALLAKSSPHWNTIQYFREDPKIQYAIADSQGRIRDMFRGYYSELMLVHEDGAFLTQQSPFIAGEDGEESLREKTTGPETYVFYIRNVISDQATFIKQDLLQIIARNNTNTSVRAVVSTLEWLSAAYTDPKTHKLVDDFISRVLVQMAYFMQNNIEQRSHKDIAHVMSNLKNLFLSTRSVDPDLLKIREIGETIIEKSQGKLSTSLMMATRTAVIMYICLRSIVGKKS